MALWSGRMRKTLISWGMKNDFMAYEIDLEECIEFAQEDGNVCVGEGGLYFM